MAPTVVLDARARKVVEEKDEQLQEARDEIGKLRSNLSKKEKALKEATESLTRLRRQHTELQSKHDSLSELSTQQQQTIERLEDELAKANRLNRNYLNEVTKQDQMLSLVCAYKGEDERRDIAMLLHENITLEEKVERLQAQVKRLARENVAALNEDWEGFDD